MRARWILGLLLLLCGTAARANVSLKNGNFFIGYTDVVYSGGFEPKIERVYNSKTPFKGIFGWGWGCEFEVTLVTLPSGLIVANEYGGGAENVFAPAQMNADLVEKDVVAITAAAVESNTVGPGPELDAYRVRLRTDLGFRLDEWNRFQKLQLVRAPSLPIGTVVWSQRFSFQYITRTRGGYVRAREGREEHFDAATGKLLRVVDRNNNFVALTYGPSGRLDRIVDNDGRFMKISSNIRGFVERIDDDRGRSATYEYNDVDELVRSRDVDGNAYAYEYDRRHNMQTIRYDDKTTMEMVYAGRDLHENIKEVKDRDNSRTSYDYVVDPKDRGHYKIAVDVRGADGRAISKSVYEYFIKHDERGSEYTARMITDLDGDVTDTTYQRDGGLPVVITHGGETTRFAYDERGHVTRKETPTELTELTYDPQVDKVSQVKLQRKGSSERDDSRFEYDPKGNLRRAEDSHGHSVRLEYDEHGRISTMTNQENKRLEFTYNRQSKPEEIRLVSVGSIKVAYNADGEIKKVESPEGRTVSLAVTTLFQELLDIIRPAGVSLSF